MGAFERQVGGDHYSGSIQPIEFILANGIPFVEGTVIKYVYRWRDKGGVQDLEKAIHYLQMLIEHYEQDVQRQREAEEPDGQESWITFIPAEGDPDQGGSPLGEVQENR